MDNIENKLFSKIMKLSRKMKIISEHEITIDFSYTYCQSQIVGPAA